jgi:hypothetical protein
LKPAETEMTDIFLPLPVYKMEFIMIHGKPNLSVRFENFREVIILIKCPVSGAV